LCQNRYFIQIHIALPQVFAIVAQLVYWGRATIIYPLCESNVYTVSPSAPTAMDSALVQKFAEEFKGATLLQLMADFSLGMSLSQLQNPMQNHEQRLQLVCQVIWLLKHRIIFQLHTFVYFVPLAVATPYLRNRPPQVLSVRRRRSSTGPLAEESGASSLESPLLSPSFGSGGNVSSRTEESDEEAPSTLNSKDLSPGEEESGKAILSAAGLALGEVESVLRVAAANNLDDLRLFARLLPYFGDMMYYENVRRSLLLPLIEKFREVLFTAISEDQAVAQLCPYDSFS